MSVPLGCGWPPGIAPPTSSSRNDGRRGGRR
jgi:hypothetical protein